MEFQICDHQSLDVTHWDKLARRGSFFESSLWVDVCAAGMSGSTEICFLCGYESGRLVAGLPAVMVSKLGQKSFLSMPYGTYGGVLFDEAIDSDGRDEFISNMENWLRKKRFSLVSITDFAGRLADWRPKDFERTSHFTHIIELEAGGQFVPTNRNLVKNLQAGEKAAGDIIRIENIDRIKGYYDLYLATESRHGRKKPLYNLSFFEAVMKVLGNTDSLYWTALMVDGEMIGSQISFCHHDTLFYWQAVSAYEKRQFKANYRLLFDAITYGNSRGVTKINLGASPPEAEGLIYFKECWGAKRVEYDGLDYRSPLRKFMGR
ncbi:MAG: GNAT family N-acetyltransferase [FCB group bacterium]|nr:GNAT family N-acetyltransferase [FCB group bacterium]